MYDKIDSGIIIFAEYFKYQMELRKILFKQNNIKAQSESYKKKPVIKNKINA